MNNLESMREKLAELVETAQHIAKKLGVDLEDGKVKLLADEAKAISSSDAKKIAQFAKKILNLVGYEYPYPSPKKDEEEESEKGSDEVEIKDLNEYESLVLAQSLKGVLEVLAENGYSFEFSDSKAREDEEEEEEEYPKPKKDEGENEEKDEDGEIAKLLEDMDLTKEEKSAWTDCIKKQMKKTGDMKAAAKVCRQQLGKKDDDVDELKAALSQLNEKIEAIQSGKEKEQLEVLGKEVSSLKEALSNLNPGSGGIKPDGKDDSEDFWAGAVGVSF